MVAAAEAGGDWQDWQVKEAMQIEEEALELREAFTMFDEAPFGVYYNCAPSKERTDTMYNARTGNKLSLLVVRNGEQFGAREMNTNEGGPWRSPRTDPPTNVKF